MGFEEGSTCGKTVGILYILLLLRLNELGQSGGVRRWGIIGCRAIEEVLGAGAGEDGGSQDRAALGELLDWYACQHEG